MNKTIIYTAFTLLIVNATQTLADVVTADDAIIQGRACIGVNCVNNEVFGIENIRLKQENNSIFADDTSDSSYADNDWQLTFNDYTLGGANKFSVEDKTHLLTPFTITANAPTNSLFVSSSGNIGLGTSVPAQKLHILQGFEPTIRLEQDTSLGFYAQTWDIGGSDDYFFY
ncbi:hypothetical protein [Methylocucumis oryzae]|uniref:hypothetical protein n=1 Tax=Methylocucumis oryzae TaxID=1632867 RepID=UPI000698BB48|nr:hypothetical protein [Methylocucumis oryzae]